MFAAHGYVTLVVDLYQGKTGSNPDENVALMTNARAHPDVVIANLDAAQKFLRARSDVSGKIGVMGWCFGGGIALSYALGGADHDATAIFYGSLVTDPAQLRRIHHPIYGTFAGQDRGIPPTQVAQFRAVLDSLGIKQRHSRLRSGAARLLAVGRPRPGHELGAGRGRLAATGALPARDAGWSGARRRRVARRDPRSARRRRSGRSPFPRPSLRVGAAPGARRELRVEPGRAAGAASSGSTPGCGARTAAGPSRARTRRLRRSTRHWEPSRRGTSTPTHRRSIPSSPGCSRWRPPWPHVRATSPATSSSTSACAKSSSGNRVIGTWGPSPRAAGCTARSTAAGRPSKK